MYHSKFGIICNFDFCYKSSLYYLFFKIYLTNINSKLKYKILIKIKNLQIIEKIYGYQQNLEN